MMKKILLIMLIFIFLVPNVLSFTGQEINDSIILVVPFDEGLTKDVSTFNRVGTFNGGAFISPNVFKIGNASAFFDATQNNPITFAADAGLNNMGNGTISFWSNATDQDKNYRFVSRGLIGLGDWQITGNTGGASNSLSCAFRTVQNGVQAVANIPSIPAFYANSDFELITCSWNFTQGNVFVDLAINGTVLATGSNVLATVESSQNTFIIGDRDNDDPSNLYLGGLDDICLFNISLPSQDIIEHIFNAGAGASCAGIAEAALDVTPPVVVSAIINNTAPGFFEDILFNVTVTDDENLNTIFIADNRSGSFLNFTSTLVSGTSDGFLFNLSAQVGTIQLQATVIDANDNSDQSDLITLEGVAITTNISNIIDTFEFDTTSGNTPTSIIVSEGASSSIIATFYEGVQSDGFVTTFKVLHNGSIIQTNIDTFEFDGTQGIEPSALKISDTTFAVVYRGTNGDGFAKTIEILNNGTIIGTIETLEVEDTDLNHANLFFIEESKNFIGVTSSQTTVNGILGIGFIEDNGTINRTDRLVYNDTQANRADSINVTNNIVLIVYHADIGSDNFGGALETIEVLSNGSVVDTIDYEILDAGQGDSPSIARIDSDTFAIFYEGVGTAGIVKTFDVSSLGIISSVIDSFTYDGGDGTLPNAITLNGNIILNVYEDAGTLGQLIAIEISDDGIINNTILDSLTFENTLSTWQEIINIKNDIFLITYTGVGIDGFVKTVNISSSESEGVLTELNVYTSSGDTTPPNITLIFPANNSINNTNPLDIFFSVVDDSGNLIDCNLNNNTITFDQGTFLQNITNNLTLDPGQIAIDQTFGNLNLVCFDNAPLNNSASLLLNFTIDTIDPIIIPIRPDNQTTFNSDIFDTIRIEANCTDTRLFKFNISIINESDFIDSFQDTTVTNNILRINEDLDISNLGLGNYTVRHTCSDTHTKKSIKNYNVNKNVSGNSIKWVTPTLNEFEFKFSTPPKNPVSVVDYGWNKLDDRYTFWYQLNATEDGTEYEWEFELENKKFPVIYLEDSEFKAHFIMQNNWLDLNFIGNEGATYIVTLNANNNYEIKIITTKTFLNFTSVGELNTVVLDTQFEIFFIEQAVDRFSFSRCPENLTDMILLILLAVIAFVVIIMGLHFNVGILGFFGSLLLLVMSWFIAPCLAIFGFLLGALSIVLMAMFIWTGLRIPTDVTTR